MEERGLDGRATGDGSAGGWIGLVEARGRKRSDGEEEKTEKKKTNTIRFLTPCFQWMVM